MISFKDVRTEWFGPITFTASAGAAMKILTPSVEASGAFTRVAAGLAKPDSGVVTMLGLDIYSITEEEYISMMKNVGLAPRSGGMISNLPTHENIALPALYHGKKTMVELEDLTSRILAGLNIPEEQGLEMMRTPPHKLKPYQKRIATMIRAQAMEPVLMIYEEIASQLNADIRKNVIQSAMNFHSQGKQRVSIFVTCDESSLNSIPAAETIVLGPAKPQAERE